MYKKKEKKRKKEKTRVSKKVLSQPTQSKPVFKKQKCIPPLFPIKLLFPLSKD